VIIVSAIEVQQLSWIQTIPVVNSGQVTEIQQQHNNIDLGEAEAIILSIELKADLLLMDERRGRAVALQYGLNVTGLLGVLLQAKKQGIIPAIKLLIDRLIAIADFRVNQQLYVIILQSADED
jgi:uncharacterized protein